MASASDSSRAWRIAENGRATALVVQLRQRVYVLPWSLFLYAEGTETLAKGRASALVTWIVLGTALADYLFSLTDRAISCGPVL